MSATALLEHLYTAHASRFGVVLAVSDTTRVRQQLYAARRQCGDPELDCLQFRLSPTNPEGELWIVKGTSKPPAQTSPLALESP
jgi:hypothetical protein